MTPLALRPLLVPVLTVGLLAAAPSPADAQRAPGTRVSSAATDVTDADLAALRWRLVGPFRGGRVGAVVGDPTQRLVFYMGAVNGGVWKTTNAGQSWTNLTDSVSTISSVGAIAIAPSDANVIYVGTGERDLREDLTHGNGVWRSTDGGATWKSLGLADTRQTGAIRVDPRDPDRVYVAAMGHAFGPNRERGIYRSLDGGTTWKQVLFLDDSTGAIDLAMDPSNPRILYAAMWKFQRFPWGMNQGGGKTGIYKSTDGGDTWTSLTDASGLPARPLGRIGLAVSPARPQRVWASVEAPDSSGGIFRSDDGGASWTRVNGEQKFHVRAWYYSTLTADPLDENTVYVMNLSVHRSVDGGKTFERVRVPHGDTHFLWIDPKDNTRMINGNDGGATVSLDGGRTWSSVYNQPTAQFYHVTTDNRFPYRILGAQQDNSTVSITSRSDNGAIGPTDYHSVGGCENAYIAVDPRNPDIAYAGCYMGTLTRYDHAARQTRDISVGLANYDGHASRDVPERFAWTYPILLSPHDPKTLYISSQHVWKSTDEGHSWAKISPDLSRADPRTMGPSGGPVHFDMTGTEWYAMVFALAESPLVKGVLWAGTDDGLVHVTRDGGGTWTKITPPGFGDFTKVSIIEPSHFDAGTAYVAANRYQQDDYQPYLWKTTDYGATWTKIVRGIPDGAFTRAIREDPKRRGVLYAGTELGVFVSFDDGASWRPLQQNLPRVSVRDLRVHEDDLIAATHGRAFWSLDDLTPLRAMADSLRSGALAVAVPAVTTRFAAGRRGGGVDAAANPWPGIPVSYWLRQAPADSLVIEFATAKGELLRRFVSKAKTPASDSAKAAAVPAAYRPVTATQTSFEPSDSVPHARAGLNRFVWNLRMPGPKLLSEVVTDDGMEEGPLVPPGEYRVRVIAGRDTATRTAVVRGDPRLSTTQAEYVELYTSALRLRDQVTRVSESAERVVDLKAQIGDRVTRTAEQPYAERVKSAAKPLTSSLEGVRAELIDVHSHASQITLHYPIKLYNKLLYLNLQLQDGDGRPTTSHLRVLGELTGEVNGQLGKLEALERNELAAFNRLLEELKVPGVMGKSPPRPAVVP
ncbi:MAG: glycosyl hydrolase [Gemmatimonadaceae bacterium]|jgi:photosystem II stability/assembly factor-like uncharacterized protein|nr:glycosyl hydrolase [Gemmatimonadaceae bacterium]